MKKSYFCILFCSLIYTVYDLPYCLKIERWTARTNQAVAQAAKTENEEVKKLQAIKTQNEKLIVALQGDAKRTKQQLEVLRRESLKWKNENSENQVRFSKVRFPLADHNRNMYLGINCC